MLLPALYALTIIAAEASAQSCPDRATVVFDGVDVLAMTSDSLLRNQTVVIANQKIASISRAPVAVTGACRIDGRGKVLLPGLADMHAHTSERDLPMFLANGVTLVREMNGSPAHLALRKRIADGTLRGPRLLVTSTLLVGTPLRYRHRMISSAAEASQAAREFKDAGYDYLKIYDGLSADAYAAFVEASRSLGIPLDGHVPQAVGLAGVLAAGQSIQHLDKIVFALGLRADTARLADFRRAFAANPVWITPTLASLRAMDQLGTADYAAQLARPEMALADSGSIAWWTSLRRDGTRQWTPSRNYEALLAVLRSLRAVNARMLLGTDAANPLMLPGYSVHDEMEALVRDGGLTPIEVLRMATSNAADFIGETKGGRIVAGARADLILVEGNPLENLASLRRPLGVMVAGKWLNRDDLSPRP